MKAIIPVAGSGTRLRPLTHSKPKALLPVGSKPIIAHIIDSLLPLGCSEFILIISHEGANIPRYLKDRYPDAVFEAVVQEEKLGLGHAVNLARELTYGEEVIIMYGDTIIDGDFSSATGTDADGIIAVREVDDPRRFGVVNLDGGSISKFVEKPDKPESNLAIVGFNYFRNSAALFDALETVISGGMKTRGEFQITDAFQVMVERGAKLRPLTIDGWFDCGTPETLLATNRYMLSKEAHDIAIPGSVVVPPVYIAPSAKIMRSIIGPHVSVGENAQIEGAIITDSIIGADAAVRNAVLESSLIGDNAHVMERPRMLSIGDHSMLDFSGCHE